MQFENLGSLITIQGSDECLGYLFHADGRGVYDATHGKVEIDPQYVDPHNRALDAALLEGLDEACEVGQGGSFYFNGRDKAVKTFIGTLVSDRLQLTARTVEFERHGRRFRGRKSKGADLMFFERIA